MSKERPIIFQVESHFPGIGVVTLHQDTWERHVIVRHPEMIGHEVNVEQTVVTPAFVLQSTTSSSMFVFVNGAAKTPNGSPLTVVVDPDRGIVLTATFNRQLRKGIKSPETIVWPNQTS